MQTITIIIGGVLVWLWMTRLAYRWNLELRPRDVSGVGCLLFWWIIIWVWLPEYLKKRYRRRELPRWVVGESRWHRRERLDREHKARAKELGIPE